MAIKVAELHTLESVLWQFRRIALRLLGHVRLNNAYQADQSETYLMTKRAVLLQALESTPADVDRLIAKLDEAAAAWHAPGDWSCRDVVAHLDYVEPLYLARLQRILAEEEPAVPFIHPDETAHDHTLPIMQLAERFRADRQATLAFLQTLSPAGWRRAALHERNGRTTLRHFVQALVEHDIDHTNQLVEIQGRRRAILRQEAAPPGN